MELAAVVMAPDEKDFASLKPALSLGLSSPFYSPLLPILGNDVRRTWTERVRRLGAQSFWLTSIPHDQRMAYSQLFKLAKQGVERILMIKLKFYVEMDLADLLRFHCQSHSSMTEVRDSRGQLGVSVLDRPLVLEAAQKDESLCTPTKPVTYPFSGYAKRILSPRERQELVGDALAGTCDLRPAGTEVRERVWLGEGVSFADSAKALGPTYIGDYSVVRAGVTVGPFTSVERECVVDCGTTLERSTVLPHTYLAPGLLVRKALVDGSHLEDLCSATVVDLQQCGLSHRLSNRNLDVTAPIDTPVGSSFEAAHHTWASQSPIEWRNVQ